MKNDKGIVISYSSKKERMPVWDKEEKAGKESLKKYNYEL